MIKRTIVSHCVPLEQVEWYKDLGVLFDSFLLFDQHISNIVSKAYLML